MSYSFLDLRRLGPLMGVAKNELMANTLVKGLELLYRSPTREALEQIHMSIWGEVTNARGEKVERVITTGNAYLFTADASVACVKKALSGTLQPGYQTPARVFGADFLFEIPGGRLIR